MANRSCTLIPKVSNSNGQVVDSKLFKDLLSLTGNRSQAKDLYLKTKSADFIQNWIPKLELDSNKEPTIKSLIQKTNITRIVPETQTLESLNREIGYYKKGLDRSALYVNNEKNYQKLFKKALQFNKESNFRDTYVARIIKIADSESNRVFLGIKIEKRNRQLSIEADKMEYNFNLNNRLREILASHGVSIGVLTDLEKRLGYSGVADFDTAKVSAEGLIELIRLAKGIRGEKALPEEFAHFAIEAMGDSPIVNRLLNHLYKNNLTETILGKEYDSYSTLYNNDEAKLAKEAAGKLLAKHLLNAEPIVEKTYKNILKRVIDVIKNFFRGFSSKDIQSAIKEADKDFGEVARKILDGTLDSDIDIKNISSTAAFYQISERVTRDKQLLEKVIDNESKRLKIYSKRNPKSKFSENQRLLIDRLTTELSENNEIEGIYVFLENALGELEKLNKRLISLQNSDDSINKKASVLRDVRNYLYSYQNIIKDIRTVLLDEEKYQDNRYGNRVRVVLDNSTILLQDLDSEYKKVSMPLFIDFIKPFIGESITIPFGKLKGKTFTTEKLVKVANDDISIFDRWLDSMAESSDYILKIMDQAVKKSKELARLSTISIRKELESATIKLEEAGIKDTKWMFEKDSEGNLTGNYISEINLALFKEKVREMYESLNSKYGRDPIEEDAKNYNEERIAWFDANMEIVDGVKRPKKSIYGNKQFSSLNSAQKEYYDTIMSIKSKLDSYLPDKYTSLTSAVKIRKDLLERVKNSDGVKSGTKQLWESIKDGFIRRTDDTDFGDKATLIDFEGNAVQSLPIYYTKLKEGESPNDISTDIVSTLTAYAAMANDYNEMSRVIDALELGRDMLKERKVIQTQGESPLVEKFEVAGKKIENYLTKEGGNTRFFNRLNDFFEMQVYGRYMADEGTFGKTNIDKGKVANFVNRVTSLNTLALNILSGVSNVITGRVMMRIESFSGEFFKVKNTITADRIYGQTLPEFLAEIGSRVKTNKLALWNELFNVMQEYEQNIRDTDFNRKSWYSRMFNTSTLFFMNNAGEHWMQTRTSLALADAYKMKAPNGKIVSLWEAMEVVPIDPNNKKLGATLQVKEGYTKEDGTEFTEEDTIKFSLRSADINQKMHGIYNKANRSAIQRLAIGRMGMMFRKWIKPSLNRRFKSATYNFDLDAWTEGYYRTSGRFLLQLARDLKETQFNLAARWDELNNTEKANIIRALTEVGHFLGVTLIIGLIEWSDDDDRPWLIRMTEYQARRLYTELGVLIPGKSMISEGLKILKSPAAGINTLEGILDLTNLLNPWNYADELQSGRYEGHSTAYKSFFESPIIPMNKTIYRGLHPEESIAFFKQ